MSEPKPCPFCGVTPDNETLFGHPAVRCVTEGCPIRFAWHSPDVWNRRALGAGDEVRHPMADVARLCIVNALWLMGDVAGRDDEDRRRLNSAHRYLRQALDALRPPAPPEPVSTTFWLGADAA